ncbi:unnamed protein product [Vitrella brassicaformis CCMP3155]|uniref:Apple domain-containing protein n=2 Tax=Vitrella brassicaformis TaxID=1169539 RepID=A0A0G4EVW8_VITBC|nr:unnamed protein product [Vitrella brassicaformis CCMP3155]|eukprot:CEM02347.1 unnamed protein product [Vitrella brassicaformis CCMP3155]
MTSSEETIPALSRALLLLAVAAWLPRPLQGKARDEWVSSRRVVYHVLTDRFAVTSPKEDTCEKSLKECPSGGYCGGSWKAMEEHLPYLKELGISAIWISPIQDQLQCGYHGYHPRNWSAVNSHFGSEDDLKSLITTSHGMDIWIMADVVMNHVAPVGKENLHLITPFNRTEYFHADCKMDFQNPSTFETCWLWGLPDLKHEDAWVREQLLHFVDDLAVRWEFDGFRIDAVKHVPRWFWQDFHERLQRRVFTVGEELSQAAQDVGKWQDGKMFDGMLNYPMYFALREVFVKKRPMHHLSRTLTDVKNKISDVAALALFVENHDFARFLYAQPDEVLYRNALTFILAAEGIPFIYYGTEQGYVGAREDGKWDDNSNRSPLWLSGYNTTHPIFRLIKRMTFLRSQGIFDGRQEELIVRDNTYVFTRKGAEEQPIIITSNTGGGNDHRGQNQGSREVHIPPSKMPHKRGTLLCDALAYLHEGGGGRGCYRVTKKGLTARIHDGQPLVLMNSDMGGCFESAAYMGSPDISAVHAFSAEHCQMACFTDKKCRHFTFYPTRKNENCNLKEGNIVTRQLIGGGGVESAISGPRSCGGRGCFEETALATKTIASTRVRSASQCQTKCMKEDMCRFFTYMPTHEADTEDNCFLKSSDAKRRPSKGSDVAVSGPKFCPSSGGFELAYYDSPTISTTDSSTSSKSDKEVEVASSRLEDIPSTEACQRRCQRSPACRHFSYIASKTDKGGVNCLLLDSDRDRQPLPEAEGGDTELGTHMVISGPKHSSCLETQTRYIGGKTIKALRNAPSAIACQSRCARTADCVAFTYRPELRICVLKSDVGERERVARREGMAISGPPVCA